MSEYYRKNQYFNGTNFGDYRYSPGENRNSTPSPNSLRQVETHCYECGNQIVIDIPYKVFIRYVDRETEVVNEVESHLCAKCLKKSPHR